MWLLYLDEIFPKPWCVLCYRDPPRWWCWRSGGGRSAWGRSWAGRRSYLRPGWTEPAAGNQVKETKGQQLDKIEILIWIVNRKNQWVVEASLTDWLDPNRKPNLSFQVKWVDVIVWRLHLCQEEVWQGGDERVTVQHVMNGLNMWGCQLKVCSICFWETLTATSAAVSSTVQHSPRC